tara:strand:+ start:8095 stop:8370 length:276 start_codon:yes stop_codon:yes gene_type:complete
MSDIAQLEMRLCKSNDKISQLKGDVKSLKETVKKLELQFNNYVIENQQIAFHTPYIAAGDDHQEKFKFHIDPNKRNWEYDACGNKVLKEGQ